VKPPRFRSAWIMVAVAIAAINFGAMRALFDPGSVGVLLLFGALPMANVLIVGILIARQRVRSRPFLLGFEVFGALALSIYVLLSFIADWPGPIISYLELVWNPLNGVIGAYPPPAQSAIGVFVGILMLLGPQLAFALIGGFLSRSFKITVTRR
jgi:hypothetical protein